MGERDPDGTLLTDDPNTLDVDTQDTGDQTDTQDESDKGADDTSGSEKPELLAGKYKTQDELIAGYKSLEGLLGKSVQIPGEDASDEERAKFHTKLGVPDSPDGYDFGEVKGMSEEVVTQFKEFALSANLPPAQAMSVFTALQSGALPGVQNGDVPTPMSKSEALRSLVGKWGADTKAKLVEAQQTVRNGGPELTKFIKDYKIGNHPVMLSLLAEAGGRYSEETLLSGDLSGDESADVSLEAIFK